MSLNLYVYCYGNPVGYVDSEGNSATEALNWWASAGWTIALLEPTVIGEIIYVGSSVVLVVIAFAETAILADMIVDVVQDATDNTPNATPEDDPKLEDDDPAVSYPGDDPTVAPDGYEWTGKDQQGGKRGGYKNTDPNRRDSWHPDLNHPDGVRPHWDYNDGNGGKWRVFPDGIERVK